ncbi:MAG: elongation factor G [Candidatus Marinimicrobia bacterium]|jgi:elongation factor G|nr:elongation factor G [Candidatus Neomarinimicrobiota bacterium]|tara:strand:- start:2884 stop:4962 length:2079 start_codon:yes stop_codon:yes gene_type:complete
MSTFQSSNIRNFAIVGHGTSGKTVLAEAMLYNGGETNRIGKIEDGTTISDYHINETSRQISISTTPLYCECEGKKFNILDAPGFLDFIGEARSSIHVADSVLIAVPAVSGPEAGTDLVWKYAEERGIPKLIVVTMLNKEHTKFDTVMQEMTDHFSKRIFPFLLPVNAGPGFNQIADVLRRKMLTYKTDGSGKYEEEDLPDEWQDRIDQLHEELIEYIAESDDSLLEKFFDQGNLSEEELRDGLHDAIQNRTVIPLVCSAADANVGVTRIMDLIAKYCPSPADKTTIEACKPGTEEAVEFSTSESDPASILVFKTVSEPHVGELSFFKVYSGSVKNGIDLKNTTRQSSERLGQIFVMNGKNRKDAGQLFAGDIGAVVKLKNTHTGDTLCEGRLNVELRKVEFPTPSIHEAVITKSKGDEEKIATGLATLHEEDPTFVYRVDPELKQTIISGQGELQLEIVVERLRRKFNVEVGLVEPRVPFRETIKSEGSSKYRHKKQSGGAGQFAEVWMSVEPLERGGGIEFNNSLVGQNVDRVFVPSVEKGVNAACAEGILAGYMVVDLKANFYDGKQHPVDSKDIAFQIAGKGAFREAFMMAKPCLLEPINEIEVRVPEQFMGDVMGDISGRRGKILGMGSESGFQVIRALIPQANLYRYSTSLRSLTGGRGMHSEKFSHYEEMPKDLEQKVVAASKEDD